MEITFAPSKPKDVRPAAMKHQSGVVDDVNIVARLKGWGEDGTAEVELLVDVQPFKLGERFTVEVRSNFSVKFDGLRAKGLRVGGLVLLRKAFKESPDKISCKSAETITYRETDGYTVILHNAAVCILPSPSGSKMVSECLVALSSAQVSVRSVTAALNDLKPAIEEAVQLGIGGIILTGEDASGEISEVIIGGKKPQTAEELVSEFMDHCPRSTMKQVMRSKKPWKMVAFFKAGVDVERSSKMSAQRLNHDYGTSDIFNWSKSNVVLREAANAWTVCETAPPMDGGTDVVGFLIDKL